MKIIRGLDNVTTAADAPLTVGSFDGVHLGHQRIIAHMRRSGHRPVTVMTFDPHPQMILRNYGDPPSQLTSFTERAEIFEKLGVDRLIIARFSDDFAAISAEDFIERILLQKVGMSSIFVGPTHGFGSGRKGDTNLLVEMGERLKFSVEIVPPVVRDGWYVSSSRIRKCLDSGDVYSAYKFLARPYSLRGEVINGSGRGRKIGFPTANMRLIDPEKLLPAPGVYATFTQVNGMRYPSVSHIGERPTFADSEPSLETYLIGFAGDIYGREITIGLVDKIRNIERFDSPEQLTNQISEDADQAMYKLIGSGFGSFVQDKNHRFGNIGEKQNLEIECQRN